MQGISDLMWPNKPLYEVLFWATALIFSQTLLYKSTASNWKFLNNAISQIHKYKYMASAMTLAALRVSEPVAETEGERERERVRGRETWIFDGFSSFFFAVPIENWNWFHWKLWYAIFGITEWSMEAKKYNKSYNWALDQQGEREGDRERKRKAEERVTCKIQALKNNTRNTNSLIKRPKKGKQ